MTEDHREPPWPESEPGREQDRAGGASFAELHRVERLLLDRLASSALPEDVSAEVTGSLQRALDVVERYQVPEPVRRDGWQLDLPGRGSALLPPYYLDSETAEQATGRVTFTRFYLGGNGAAHGGAIQMLFDDVLGRMANLYPGRCRTAYLTVNFRAIVPLDLEVHFIAATDRVEGRKRYCTGRILAPDDTLLADAEALFVVLRPGQP